MGRTDSYCRWAAEIVYKSCGARAMCRGCKIPLTPGHTEIRSDRQVGPYLPVDASSVTGSMRARREHPDEIHSYLVWCTQFRPPGVDPTPLMIDENAFGLLIAYLNIEDDEYDGEREHFVVRYKAFTTIMRSRLHDQPPSAGGARATELGHAFYVELIEGDGECDLIDWLRTTRATLSEPGFVTAGILTYGSSWYDDADPHPALTDLGTSKLVTVSRPSEPLRRALRAEAASRGDEDFGESGWGPGLYLHVEAVEALGRKPKNQPTILRSGGAEFYRAGS